MYCRKCGSQNYDGASKCANCGESISPAGGHGVTPPQKIPNYLAQAIIVALFCCMPLGIPAIIFAVQVNSKLLAGDIQGALEASRKAKVWCWWSFGVGFVVQALYVLLVLIGHAL